MVDSHWVDQRLKFLSVHFSQVMQTWKLFEPTLLIYAGLESGEDEDLEAITTLLAGTLKLELHPSVTYEWGLRLDPDVAGQIRQKSGLRSHIQIPLFYVGKPEALGAILAHELTHEALAQEKLEGNNLEELELLTDLTSLVLGLGKLVLNGTLIEVGEQTGQSNSLGYLKPELKVYAYKKIIRQHRIPEQIAFLNLNQQAQFLLRTK